MPHINCIYPFLAERDFRSNVDKITAALSKIPAFKVTMKEYGFFDFSKNVNLHLEPHAEVIISFSIFIYLRTMGFTLFRPLFRLFSPSAMNSRLKVMLALRPI